MSASGSKRWLRRLQTGAGGDDTDVRQALGLAHDADDAELARALVRAASARLLGEVSVAKERKSDPHDPDLPEPMAAADSSFLGRFRASAASEVADVRTLLAILRAGTLAQRRAAAVRLRQRLTEDRDLSNDEQRAVATTLLNVRDVELALEVMRAREGLAGARGREARDESEQFARIVEKVVKGVDEFWAGLTPSDPVLTLPSDERAQLVLRLRETPDVVIRHVCAVLEGADGTSARPQRGQLLGTLRFSGDPRLVPSLLGLLTSRAPELVSDAVRALGRIDDPRVHPALAAAYEQSVVDAERAVLAGALGHQGDVRGRSYVRKLLRSDDAKVLANAVEAMASLATSEDIDLLKPLLSRTDPLLLAHVVRALGRSGNARALVSLSELRRDSALSALWSDAEDAEASIRAQLELRGEQEPPPTESVALERATRSGIADRARDPTVVRFWSWWDFIIGQLWLGIGAKKRGVARFERAAARSPGWAAPLAAIALLHVRQERPALALSAFRRALEADRDWVQGQSQVIHSLARVFLRRADEVERGGRLDIARGLVEEVLSLDLRRLPSELRFELSRRQETLRARGAA